MKEQIKQYLEQLNERERRAVIAAVVMIILFVPYQFIWKPFINSLNEMEERVEQQQKDLAWMQSHVREARELSRSGGKTVTSGQPVYGAIESTARQQFGGEIRVQQEGKGGIRVSIKNVAFDDIMLWLDELYYKQHVNVKEFTVNRESGAGRVTANILIES
jgi:type II secretory pathway component PulM